MPKKQSCDGQEAQSERFVREAQRLIDAGELNPTEANVALDSLVRRATSPKTPSPPTGDGEGI